MHLLREHDDMSIKRPPRDIGDRGDSAQEESIPKSTFRSKGL